jgi:hypothetical protein
LTPSAPAREQPFLQSFDREGSILRGSCSALKEAASVDICDTFTIPLACPQDVDGRWERGPGLNASRSGLGG